MVARTVRAALSYPSTAAVFAARTAVRVSGNPDRVAIRSRAEPGVSDETSCNAKGDSVILSVRLPEEVEARLERLAKETGRTKSYYARAAILEKIEDMEDMHLAEHVLDRIRKGEENIVSADEIWRELEDCER